MVDGGSDGVGSLVEGMVSAPPEGSLVGGTSEPGTVPAEPSPCRVSSTTSLELSGRPSVSSATTWYSRATSCGAAGSVNEVI